MIRKALVGWLLRSPTESRRAALLTWYLVLVLVSIAVLQLVRVMITLQVISKSLKVLCPVSAAKSMVQQRGILIDLHIARRCR